MPLVLESWVSDLEVCSYTIGGLLLAWDVLLSFLQWDHGALQSSTQDLPVDVSQRM